MNSMIAKLAAFILSQKQTLGMPILSFVCFSVFSVSLIAPSLNATLSMEHEHDHQETSHCEKIPCPSNDDHGPCDSESASHCCLGHFLALVPHLATGVAILTDVMVTAFSAPDTHNPSGVIQAVFRPPRA